MSKKKTAIFVESKNTIFDYTSADFSLFDSIERISDEQKALKLIYANSYDVVISDVSGDVIEGTTFMLQIKKMKPEQEIYTLVAMKDEENIGGLIDGGVHSFVLEVEQFAQAIETIADL
ncbi:MAG: response regulator transcription factor [Campylobacterales bacterium]|nr:response regulator transcription factor [Campylobacterales bacterium]